MRLPRFFKKKCFAPGHSEEVITVFPPGTPHKIFDFSFYHSDDWDPLNYGRDIDPDRPFWEQLSSFFFEIPHMPLEKDPLAVNSDYTLGGKGGRDNYYSGMAFGTEGAYYCLDARFSKDVFDCNLVTSCELCYQSVGSSGCSNCSFVDDCENCINSSFLFDCKNCSDCFFSFNLRNKSYVFGNEQLTKEGYEKKIGEIDLGNRETLNDYWGKFRDFTAGAVRRNLHNVNAVNSLGEGLTDCKSCHLVFRASGSENSRYCDLVVSAKDCMDMLNTASGERNYESVVTLGRENRFCLFARNVNDSEYCVECKNCESCFGCVGLRDKKFHIFNKPYGEDEYWRMVDDIKSKMLQRGEYGEFFPLELGLMPYQNSFAQRFFVLDPRSAAETGTPWYDEPEPRVPREEVMRAANLPVHIKDVSDKILEKTVECEATGKFFRFSKNELDFYRHRGLPLPDKHPWARMQERTTRERGIVLYEFTCPNCGESSYSSYDPGAQKKYKIFCEKCYLQAVV